jgi:hypothetical protein
VAFAQFDFTVSGETGPNVRATSAPATVSVWVEALNDAPAVPRALQFVLFANEVRVLELTPTDVDSDPTSLHVLLRTAPRYVSLFQFDSTNDPTFRGAPWAVGYRLTDPYFRVVAQTPVGVTGNPLDSFVWYARDQFLSSAFACTTSLEVRPTLPVTVSDLAITSYEDCSVFITLRLSTLPDAVEYLPVILSLPARGELYRVTREDPTVIETEIYMYIFCFRVVKRKWICNGQCALCVRCAQAAVFSGDPSPFFFFFFFSSIFIFGFLISHLLLIARTHNSSSSHSCSVPAVLENLYIAYLPPTDAYDPTEEFAHFDYTATNGFSDPSTTSRGVVIIHR